LTDYRRNISLSILLLFISFYILKANHNHDEESLDNITASTENIFYKKNCSICNFSFSIYISFFKIFDESSELKSNDGLIIFDSEYKEFIIIDKTHLRSPPKFT